MHDITRDFLVSLAAFATLFGIIYLIVVTRYRERMSMLERGIDPSLFASKGNKNSLKFGMLSVGIALGILIGNLLNKNDILDRAPAYFAMIFLFGGLSLVLNYIIDRKINR
jgi:predicted MFS family arabinose efflux permease